MVVTCWSPWRTRAVRGGFSDDMLVDGRKKGSFSGFQVGFAMALDVYAHCEIHKYGGYN